MTKIFDDGILEATLYPNRWVFCRWVDNKHGKLQKKLIKDLNFVERFIFAGKLNGWFTDSELKHTAFHKLLVKFGCLPREIDGNFQRFIKPLLKQSDLHQKVGG
jgi:hypothetical protein